MSSRVSGAKPRGADFEDPDPAAWNQASCVQGQERSVWGWPGARGPEEGVLSSASQGCRRHSWALTRCLGVNTSSAAGVSPSQNRAMWPWGGSRGLHVHNSSRVSASSSTREGPGLTVPPPTLPPGECILLEGWTSPRPPGVGLGCRSRPQEPSASFPEQRARSSLWKLTFG